MADDDGLDRGRVDADCREPLRDRLYGLTPAPGADRLVEAGVDQDGAARADDRPYEIIERHLDIVRIAAQKILRGLARMMAVADGVDFVGLAHAIWPAPRRRYDARAAARWW